MNRRSLRGAAALQRDLEEPRVGLLDLLVVGIQHVIDVAVRPSRARCARSVPFAFDTTVSLQAPRAQRVERRQDVVGHELPQVVRDVVGVQLGERRRRSRPRA